MLAVDFLDKCLNMQLTSKSIVFSSTLKTGSVNKGKE